MIARSFHPLNTVDLRLGGLNVCMNLRATLLEILALCMDFKVICTRRNLDSIFPQTFWRSAFLFPCPTPYHHLRNRISTEEFRETQFITLQICMISGRGWPSTSQGRAGADSFPALRRSQYCPLSGLRIPASENESSIVICAPLLWQPQKLMHVLHIGLVHCVNMYKWLKMPFSKWSASLYWRLQLYTHSVSNLAGIFKVF